MNETWYLYYGLTVFLMVGCGYMCYHTGRKEGVIKMLEFLEDHANKKGIVKMRITEKDFEIIK